MDEREAKEKIRQFLRENKQPKLNNRQLSWLRKVVRDAFSAENRRIPKEFSGRLYWGIAIGHISYRPPIFQTPRIILYGVRFERVARRILYRFGHNKYKYGLKGFDLYFGCTPGDILVSGIGDVFHESIHL